MLLLKTINIKNFYKDHRIFMTSAAASRLKIKED